MTQRVKFLEVGLRLSLLAFVWFYRILLGPMLQMIARAVGFSSQCRYPLSCSEFAIHELQKEKLPKAIFRIVRRLLSCGPWPLKEKVS